MRLLAGNMNQHISLYLVRGINPFRVVSDGQSDGQEIVLGLKIGDKGNAQDINLKLPYHMLAPLISSLLQINQIADKLRAANPLHQSGVRGGIVLDLEKLRIGPHKRKGDWHVLQRHVRRSGGSTSYLIGADVTRLENLAAAIHEYLDDIEASGQAPPIAS